MADGFCDAVRETLVYRSPNRQLPGLDFRALDVLEVARDVADIGLPLLVVPNFGPQSAWLLEIKFGNLTEIPPGTTDKALMLSKASLITDGRVDGSFLGNIIQGVDTARVVGAVALGDERCCAIALEVVNRVYGCIDRELLIVDSKTVAVGVWIREETGLEDRVGGWLDVRDKMGRRESDLLDLCKVILRVLVENELADGAQWEFRMRPDLGEIQDIVAEFLSLFGSHGLDEYGPGREFTRLNGIEE